MASSTTHIRLVDDSHKVWCGAADFHSSVSNMHYAQAETSDEIAGHLARLPEQVCKACIFARERSLIP